MFIRNSGSPLPSRQQATEDTAPEGAAPEGDWHLPGRGPRQFVYDPAWLRSPQFQPLSLSLAVGLAAPPRRGEVVEHWLAKLPPDNAVSLRRLLRHYCLRSSSA